MTERSQQGRQEKNVRKGSFINSIYVKNRDCVQHAKKELIVHLICRINM